MQRKLRLPLVNCVSNELLGYNLAVFGQGTPESFSRQALSALLWAEMAPGTPTSPAFQTTRWSVVLAAGDPQHAVTAASALDTLCRRYWLPLYTYVRRRGFTPADAQDLTQEFFARLIEKRWLQAAAPDRGRFRTFLLVAMQRLLSHERERAQAGKRGGKQATIPLDLESAEVLMAAQTGMENAEVTFDRSWALALLHGTLAKLREEFTEAGKEENYVALQRYLTVGRGEIPYRELAQQLSVSEGAARVAIHRLRQRFRELFRQAVAETCPDEAELAEELRYVAFLLGRETSALSA